MGKFGWSLPPGVTTLPGEEDCICEVCFQNVDADDCVCPECPVCGAHGDPVCYVEHGLKRTEEQKFLYEVAQRRIEDDAKAEYEYYKSVSELDDYIYD